MLKLTYTENGLHMERVATPLDVLVAQRVMLAIRAGQRLHIEPGHAAFLLAADTPGLAQLERILRMDVQPMITVAGVDQEFVEVAVKGSWLAESVEAEEGVFITAVSDMAEFLLLRLWEATQSQVSFLA